MAAQCSPVKKYYGRGGYCHPSSATQDLNYRKFGNYCYTHMLQNWEVPGFGLSKTELVEVVMGKVRI